MSNYYNRQWRLPNNENKDKQSNYSMDFDGANDYIDVGNPTELQFGYEDFSITSWFKMSTSQSNNLVGKFESTGNQRSYSIWIDESGSGFAKFVISNNGQSGSGNTTVVTDNNSLSLNNWHFVAVVYDSTNNLAKISIDANSFVTSSHSGGAYSSSTANFRISNINGLFFDGQIDAVSVYNYALSSSQITTLYGSSSTGIGNPMSLSPKPVAFYNLGDKSVFNSSSYLIPNASLKDYVFDFDGSNDYIDCGKSNDFQFQAANAFSVSAWVNINATTTGADFIVSNGLWPTYPYNGWGLEINGANTIRLDLTDDNLNQLTIDSSGLTLNTNTWYHIVFTYDGSNSATGMNFYLDGSLTSKTIIKNQTLGTITYTSDMNLNIGARENGFKPWNGSLSNIQIFNTELSSTNVETLYNNGSPLTSMSGYSSLVGWWKLDASELYSDTWSVENNASPTTFKSALDFDGTNTEYIDTNFTGLNNASTATISAWINMPVLTNLYALGNLQIDSGTYKGIGFNPSTSTAYVYVNNNTSGAATFSFNPSSYYNAGNWFHIVFVFDGSESGTDRLKVYIDKNLVTGTWSGTPLNTLETSTSNFLIGNDGQQAAPYFTGKISNVAIYNTALSASNITTLYNNGVPQATIYGSPVAHWKLDNTTTGIQDSAGSNNGTNNGATEVATYVNTTAGISSGMNQSALVQSDLSFTNGYSPYALDFDGTNDYIEIQDNNNLDFGTADFSLSAWFKTSVTPLQHQTILSKQNPENNSEWVLQVEYNTNKVAFRANATTILRSTTLVNNGNWNNVIITRISGVFYLYLNSSQENTTTLTQDLTNTQVLRIGRRFVNYNGYFDGEISNVSIWNAALTSSQVSEIYNEGVPSNLNNHSAYSNLVSWWQLGSNSSFNTNWTVLDEVTASGNNGTSVNMTEADIVDGVGSYANGVGTSGLEVIGSAPFSDANSLSVNMDVEDRVEDTPS